MKYGTVQIQIGRSVYRVAAPSLYQGTHVHLLLFDTAHGYGSQEVIK